MAEVFLVDGMRTPFGALGDSLALTLSTELQRSKARYGLATLCIGGGEALAVIFERV